MQIKDSDLKNILGKRIKITKIHDVMDEHLGGLTGKTTNPFSCLGEGCIIGVFLDPTEGVDRDICNLSLEDEIEFI